jgi:uncharacterized membrane protein YqiK
MDTKLKNVSMIVLSCVVVCLIMILVLVWTMPDLPKTVKEGEICLPSETFRSNVDQPLTYYMNISKG